MRGEFESVYSGGLDLYVAFVIGYLSVEGNGEKSGKADGGCDKALWIY